MYVQLWNENIDGMFPQLSPANAKPYDLQLSTTRSISIPAVEDGVCRLPFSRICQDVGLMKLVDDRIAGQMIMRRSLLPSIL